MSAGMDILNSFSLSYTTELNRFNSPREYIIKLKEGCGSSLLCFESIIKAFPKKSLKSLLESEPLCASPSVKGHNEPWWLERDVIERVSYSNQYEINHEDVHCTYRGGVIVGRLGNISVPMPSTIQHFDL